MKLHLLPYTWALLAAFLVLPAGPAAAYIGPGAGLGALAVTLALGVGVLLLIAGLVWYPLKRILKQRKGNSGQNETPET